MDLQRLEIIQWNQPPLLGLKMVSPGDYIEFNENSYKISAVKFEFLKFKVSAEIKIYKSSDARSKAKQILSYKGKSIYGKPSVVRRVGLGIYNETEKISLHRFLFKGDISFGDEPVREMIANAFILIYMENNYFVESKLYLPIQKLDSQNPFELYLDS